MERRPCSPVIVTILMALACLSVWQMIGCPGPPPSVYVSNPVYTLVTPSNATEGLYPTDALPPWDLSTLINLDNFKFTMINTVCNESTPLLLVLVHSAPQNTGKRKTIRNTWGEPRENVNVLFLLGQVDSQKDQRILEAENAAHGDLIQGNFKDAYRNMTYKHVMALKFAIYYCPRVKYIMKTDDDIFVNMPTMMVFLNSKLSPWGSRKLLLCTPFHNATVKRSYRSKWRVSFKEYRDPYYPTYCPGWALIYSPDVVFKLYKEAQRSEYFWIDDVHITGILAKRIQIIHTPLKGLVLTRNQVTNILRTNKTSPEFFLYGSPDLSQEDIHRLWSIVHNRTEHRALIKV